MMYVRKISFLISIISFLQLCSYGQTPGITINSIIPNQTHYCVGDSIFINFSTIDFTGTNTFTARMSKSGFALDSTNMSSISFSANQSNATILYVFQTQNADVDSNYQLRIRSGSTVSALHPPSPFFVDAKPVATVSFTTQTICSGNTFNTINLSTSNNVVNTTYAWSRNNTTNVSGTNNGTGDIIGSVLVNNTLTNQTVTYSITPTGPSPSSCTGNTLTSTVIVRPTPVITSLSSDTVCSGTRLSITLTSNIASTYSWVALDNIGTEGEELSPRTLNPLRDTIVNLTTQEQIVFYTVTPTSGTGLCTGNPQTITVTVSPKPVLTNDTAESICSGTTVILPLTSDIPSSFTWRAASNSSITGESTILQNSDTLRNTLINATTAVQTAVYTITPSSIDGNCSGSGVTYRVTIYPKPAANFSIANSASQCERGNRFQFTATQSAAISNYDWTFGSPLLPSNDTGAISIQNFTGTGDSIPVKLVIQTPYGCSDSIRKIINVYPMPVAMFSVSDTTPCSGDTVRFVQTTTNNTNSLIWLWGDGTANTTCIGCDTGKHRYSSTTFPSLRTMRLIAVTIRGCRDTSLALIDVKPNPDANFTIDDNTRCLNSSNNQFLFTNQSTIADSASNPVFYEWLFDDNSPIEQTKDASHSYAAADSYFVFHSVTSNFGCRDSILKLVVVYLNPITQIENSAGADTLCGEAVALLTADAGYNYVWSTGATTQSVSLTDSSAQVPYTIAYTVTITDNDNCSGSSTKLITVVPSVLSPEIAYDTSRGFCAGAKARLFQITNAGSSVFTWNSIPDILALNSYTGSQLNFNVPNLPGDTLSIYILAADTIWGCLTRDTVTFTISENTAPEGTIVRDFFTLICTNNTVNSYQWGYDDAGLLEHELTGETLQSYFAGTDPDFSVSGKYYWVKITDAAGCQSKIYYQSPPQYFTSVASLSANKLVVRVYPNPTENVFQIEIASDLGEHTLEIFNTNGQLVHKSFIRNKMLMDATEWSSGIYLMRITSGTGILEMLRLVKL